MCEQSFFFSTWHNDRIFTPRMENHIRKFNIFGHSFYFFLFFLRQRQKLKKIITFINQGGQVGFFSAQNHELGFFRGPWAFLFSEKKAHKIWLIWAFLKIDRKLLKFYLQNTNFYLFLIYFWSFWTIKNHNKENFFCVVKKSEKIFVSGCQICEKLVNKSAIKPENLGF